jgi:hypothetical protein
MMASTSRVSSCSSSASHPSLPVRILTRIPVRNNLVRLLLFVAFTAAFADSRPSEYDVKAAYLLNFGKFVRVEPAASASPHTTFDVCIVGDDPIESALKTLTNGERVGGLPVRVLHVKDGAQARSCQIAYLSGSEGPRLDQDLEQLRGADVLAVSDNATFLTRGGMIQFLLVSNHVRFSVSLDAVRQSHLVLSSEFLRVAYAVSGMPAKEGTQ